MTNQSATAKLTFKVTSLILKVLLNILFYIVSVILIVNISKVAYEFAYQLYGPVTMDAPGTGTAFYFQVKQGDSTMDVASKLVVNRAIKNKYSFYLKTKLKDYVIMPGTYELSTDMTYNKILSVITDYSASIINEEGTGTGPGTGSKTNTDSGTGADNSTGSD